MTMPRFVARGAWTPPGPPITGPARRRTFSRGVVHWEGVNRDRTPADVAAHLRSMQRSWVSSRGYSLGYGWAVVSDVRHPDDGMLWEVRGFDLNMASNPGRSWTAGPGTNANDWTGSVLVIGPTGVRVSDRAAATVRALFGSWHTAAGTAPVRPLAHSELDPTACCGDAYRADLAAGRFDPSTSSPGPDPVPPPPDPPAYHDPMLAIYRPTFPGSNDATEWLAVFASGTVRRATNADVRLAGTLGVPTVELDSAEQHAWLLDRDARVG